MAVFLSFKFILKWIRVYLVFNLSRMDLQRKAVDFKADDGKFKIAFVVHMSGAAAGTDVLQVVLTYGLFLAKANYNFTSYH